MFRPMLRIRQQLSDEECTRILRSEPRGVLSVLGDDGYPYGMPMNFWFDPEDGRLYFHGGRKGHKLDALAACNKASFCVYTAGERREGEWWLRIKSVIVFGRVELVTDHDRAMEISRRLSRKYTSDEAYIDDEIRTSGPGTLCFALVPEQITGKLVNEK